MFNYYLLKDSEYNGFIVKVDPKTKDEYYFDETRKGWQPIGIMIRYFWPESDTFEMYEELSEDDVNKMIN